MARKRKDGLENVTENPVTEAPALVVEQSVVDLPVPQVTAEKHEGESLGEFMARTQPVKGNAVVFQTTEKHTKIDGVYLAKQLGADRIHQDEQSITLRKGGVEVSANIKQPVENIVRAFRQMGF